MRDFNVECLMLNVELNNSKFKIQNSKLFSSKRTGFSMVELIFVIVLMGILAAIGGNLLPDNRLLNDTNYITMKIKETQKNAIGYDINGFGVSWSKEDNSTCIDLNTTGFESKNSRSQKPHKLSSTLSGSDIDKTLCFDEYGRPYKFSEQHLLLDNNITINVEYKGIPKKISVLPMSGYVILEDN